MYFFWFSYTFLAVMSVSPDFFMYRGGVYKKSGLRPGERTGYHSVRLIGWGEEFHEGEMLKYWVRIK